MFFSVAVLRTTNSDKHTRERMTNRTKSRITIAPRPLDFLVFGFFAFSRAGFAVLVVSGLGRSTVIYESDHLGTDELELS